MIATLNCSMRLPCSNARIPYSDLRWSNPVKNMTVSIGTIAIGLLTCLALLANVIASHRVIVNPFSEFQQKRLQLAFIWFVPGIGAALVLAILVDKKSKWSGKYPTEAHLGDDPNVGISNASTDYFRDVHDD